MIPRSGLCGHLGLPRGFLFYDHGSRHPKAAGILAEAKAAELAELMEATNPADLTRGITTIQTQLIALAAAKHRPGSISHASRNR